MSVGVPSSSSPSIAQYWRAARPPLQALATAALLFLPIFCNSPFCAAGDLTGRPYLPLGIFLGVFCSFLGSFALSLTHYFQKELPITRPQQGSVVDTSWMTVLVWRWIGGVLLGFGLLAWANSMLSYYCVGSTSISIHPSAFAQAKVYSWADVAGVQVGCSHSRNGIYGFFTVRLKDGRTINLPGWEGYIDEIDKALADVPFAYDDSKVGRCPSPYRQQLARRPGSSTR